MRYGRRSCPVIFRSLTTPVVMAINNINSDMTAMALVFVATFFIGWNEAVVLPICGIRIRDQQEIGTAIGVAGSARSAISTVASTVSAQSRKYYKQRVLRLMSLYRSTQSS